MFKTLFFRFSRLIVLAFLCVVLAAIIPGFLSGSNILNIIRQASIAIILASGLTLVVITAGIDLSVGSVVSFAACSAAFIMTQTPHGWGIGILGGLVAGLLVGLVNGALVAFFKIPPFVVTYGMLWIVQGLAALLMRGEIFYGFPKPFLFLGTGSLLGIPLPIILMVVVVTALSFILHRTNLGRQIYAIGDNAEAAKLSGIPITRIQLIVYSICGATSALAAMIYIARLNAADSAMGGLMLMPAIASVTVGGASLFGGVGSVTGTVIGATIIWTLINGMNQLNLPSFWQPFVTGVVIVAGVALDQYTRKKKDENRAAITISREAKKQAEPAA